MRKKCILFFLMFSVLLSGGTSWSSGLENLSGPVSVEYRLSCETYIRSCKEMKVWVVLESWFFEANRRTSADFSGEKWNAHFKLLYPEANLSFEDNKTRIELGIIPRKRSLEFSYTFLFDLKNINWWRDLKPNFFKEENLNPEVSFFIKEERPL